MVAPQLLELLVKVRTLARQPISPEAKLILSEERTEGPEIDGSVSQNNG